MQKCNPISLFGRCIEIYSVQNGFPDLANKKIAIVGVEEGRAAIGNHETGANLDEIRKELYKLFRELATQRCGYRKYSSGNSIEDTYFCSGENYCLHLIKNRIIPIIIGEARI
ncbi:MAG: hypothetical protein MH219_03665 [Marinobacter sp.]|nr:hypothetical protein [Marinobacter sp.]